MSLQLLKKQLKDKTFGQLYLFCGEEAFLKSYYAQQLQKNILQTGFEDFNLAVFSGKDIDLKKVGDAIESFPMMAEKKMIVIKESGMLKTPRAEAKDFWEHTIPDIPPYVCIVIYEEEIDKRSKIYKLIKKHGLIVEIDYLKGADLISWVERGLRSYEKRMGKETLYYFLEHCDEGMTNIKNEMEKLMHYCKDKKDIEKKDIDAVCTTSIQSKVFHMIDAMVANNIPRALVYLQDMQVLKEPVIKILTLIARQFSGILKAKLMLEDGMPTAEITKRLGISPFVAKKYIRSANQFSAMQLQNAMEKCLEIDQDIKTGKAEGYTALELFIAQYEKKRTY